MNRLHHCVRKSQEKNSNPPFKLLDVTDQREQKELISFKKNEQKIFLQNFPHMSKILRVK